MRESTKQNIRGLALLLPLITIAILLLIVARKDRRFQPYTPTTTIDSITLQNSDAVERVAKDTTSRITFDPNTADYRTLLAAGVPRNIAVSLLRWRESGKVFRIKEDMALCYGMTDSLYFLLEPYIHIAEKYRIKPRAERDYKTSSHSHTERTVVYQPFRLDTVSAGYLRSIGFSSRRADLVIRYREMIGGYRNINEFKECYAVGDSVGELLRPYIIFDVAQDSIVMTKQVEFPVEINSADSATLRMVRGIGEKSVVAIMRYRELLGGYYSVDQIAELDVVTNENFQRILQQIYCDSAKIKKININFASPKALESHPYMTNRALRRLINHRQLKGGWSTVEELIEDDIFSEDQARRIAPYLRFGTPPK